MDFAIRTSGLTRAFGSVVAVEALAIEVPRGIIFGFLGPNGSGKTSTIRLLLGLLRPTSGTAQVLGMDVATNASSIRERCGALLEHSGLYERLDAAENLDLYGRFWRIPRAARQARSRELLMRLGLWERRHDPIAGWSRGMKQKLAIARALFHRPELVFLDEPTAGLDPIAAASLREDLTHLSRDEGVSVFLTTHNLHEAERLCALVAVVNHGRLIAMAPPNQLIGHGAGSSVEIRGNGFSPEAVRDIRAMSDVVSVREDGRTLVVHLQSGADSADIVSALVAAGARVESVRNDGGSLEGAFHSIVEQSQ